MTSKQLTNREILEACARAYGVLAEFRVASRMFIGNVKRPTYQTLQGPFIAGTEVEWNPLNDDGDCARMENKCFVGIRYRGGRAYVVCEGCVEYFEPGNDAERRLASCLVVARMQLAKEKSCEGEN